MSKFSSADRAAGRIQGELSSSAEETPSSTPASSPNTAGGFPSAAAAAPETTMMTVPSPPLQIEDNVARNVAVSSKAADIAALELRALKNVDNAVPKESRRNTVPREYSVSDSSHDNIATSPKLLGETSTAKPVASQFKFQYQPHPFELRYYTNLFSYALTFANPSQDDPHRNNDPKNRILPPKFAAKLFYTSSIPPEKLRMIWNMATMPSTPIPPGTPPPPAMTFGQFCVAVRLIQLFQNKVAAKDEMLNAGVSYDTGEDGAERANAKNDKKSKDESGTVAKNKGPDGLVPAFFRGISEEIVPLPIYRIPNRRASTGSSQSMRSSIASISRRASVDSGSRRASMGSLEQMTTPEDNLQKSKRQIPEGYLSDDETIFAMSQDEILNYQSIFLDHCCRYVEGAGKDDNGDDQSLTRSPLGQHSWTQKQKPPYIPVDKAVTVFSESGLGRETLGKIWDVVLPHSKASKLDDVHFILMMHLIVCVSRKGLAVPKRLPRPLHIWKEENKLVVDADSANNRRNILAGKEKTGKSSMEKRMHSMEQEIESLKKLVLSLQRHIRVLEGTVKSFHRGSDFRGSLVGRRNSGLLTADYEAPVKYEDEVSDNDTDPSYIRSGVVDDKDGPMNGVEIYWVERTSPELNLENPSANHFHQTVARKDGLRSSVSKFIPPVNHNPKNDGDVAVMMVRTGEGIPRRASLSSHGSAGSSRRNSVSSNIPSFHPSALSRDKPTPSQQHRKESLTRERQPPAQARRSAFQDPSHGPHDPSHGTRPRANSNAAEQGLSMRHNKRESIESDGQGTAGSKEAGSRNTRPGPPHKHNKVTPVVKKETAPTANPLRNSRFVANQVLERLGGDAGSSSSSNYSRKFTEKPMRRSVGHDRPQIDKATSRRRLHASLFDPVEASSMHIKRRFDGKAEVYNKTQVKPRSTKAVDLAPLEPPPIAKDENTLAAEDEENDKTDRKSGLRSKSKGRSVKGGPSDGAGP
ncbi:hypothetical protein ACHAXS_013995 [Conticribra weissflogii]